MAKRAWMVLVLVAAALFSMNQAGAQDELTINVDPGPHAPGTEVEVTITGPPQAFGEIRQCDNTLASCTHGHFFEIDSDGAASPTVTVHRRLWRGGVVDCATTDCVLTVRLYDEIGSAAAVPLAIDGSVGVPRPTLSIDTAAPLPDRGLIEISGSGFTPNDGFLVAQCTWTSTLSCPWFIAYPRSDDAGMIQDTVPVVRVVDGVDCAAPGAGCSLWIFPRDHLDQITAAGLSFDGSSPPLIPTLTVTPDRELLHEQTVTVAGADFAGPGFVDILQCAELAGDGDHCDYIAGSPTAADGSFSIDLPLNRRVNVEDCAVSACRLEAVQYPFPPTSTPIAFDGSVPPPPIPSATVTPTDDLADRQIVDITVVDAAAGDYVSARLCADEFGCGAQTSAQLSAPTTVLQMALPRHIGDTDCAITSCAVHVNISTDTAYLPYRFPVTFDPDAPLAESRLRVIPSQGLWDRQRIEVRGTDLDAGRYIHFEQCADPEGLPGNCAGELASDSVDNVGDLSVRVPVRRTIQLADGPLDCAVAACFLVAGDYEGTLAAVELSFDPDGPPVRVDLLPQLECVAWPTDGWQTGDIPDGVDPVAVAEAGEQMMQFGDSVVVIHGGELVYENYSPDGGPDVEMSSFSMSKSFTSTVIGLLVDDGLLELDQDNLFTEWSSPGDPRQAITLRHILNMDSGLEWLESYFEGTSDVVQMVLSEDPSAFVKAKPLVYEPGTRHYYSTGDTQLLGSLIGEVAGVNGDSYGQLLHDELFEPLGILPVDAHIDPSGVWASGYRTNTTTRNFAKLGLLYLRNGVWEDEQFLSPDWVEFVRTPSPVAPGYGGQFWLNGDGSFSMIGLFGQETRIVPELDLIVSVSNGAGTYRMVDLFRDAATPTCGDADPVSVDDDEATVPALGVVDVDVLANDDGGSLGFAPATVTVADPPAHGTAIVVDGELRYESGAGFTGVDHLTYVVCLADRSQCLEAAVAIDVTPLDFRFRPPVTDGLNRRFAGQHVRIKFVADLGPGAIEHVRTVPIDCDALDPLGEPEPVSAAILTGASYRRGSFWWATDDDWTGCHRLEVVLIDGTVHHAEFAWR